MLFCIRYYRKRTQVKKLSCESLRKFDSLSRQLLGQHWRLCTTNSNSYSYLFLQDCPILAVNVAVVNKLFFSFSFFCTAVHEIEYNTKETFCICNNEGPVTTDIKSSCIWKIRKLFFNSSCVSEAGQILQKIQLYINLQFFEPYPFSSAGRIVVFIINDSGQL